MAEYKCERAGNGMSDNCALCEANNNDMYKRCKITRSVESGVNNDKTL